MNKDEEVQQVGEMIDRWLDAIDSQPEIAGKSQSEVDEIDTIIDSFVEIAIVGLNKQPAIWDVDLLADVMFSRFTLLLDGDEKTDSLFQLIPFALTHLFSYLDHEGIIKNGSQLNQWVKDNSKALRSIYDSNFDAFYSRLVKAMKDADVDLEDKSAVDAFTKKYLSQHPQDGIDLYLKKK